MHHAWKLKCSFAIVTIVLSSFCQTVTARTVNIAIISDGQSARHQLIESQFKTEIKSLFKGEFDPDFIDFRGQWDGRSIQAVVDQAYADKSVDQVLVLGLAASQIVAVRDSFSKPTFLPLLFTAEFIGLPYQTKNSGIKNLNYFTLNVDFDADLDAYLSVTQFSNLAFLVDITVYDSISRDVFKNLEQQSAKRNIKLNIVVTEDNVEQLINELPKDTDAVLLTGLPRFSNEQLTNLAERFIEKKIPSFSFRSERFIEAGILAANDPSDLKRMARSMALNMQEVLLGRPASQQPILFDSKPQLVINMRTARAIDISPPFDVMSLAELRYDDVQPQGEALSLNDVAQDAAKTNLALLASRTGLVASQQNIAEAKAQLRPQITSGLSHNLSRNNQAGSLGQPSQSTISTSSAAVTFSQLLYSDSTNANVTIQEKLQEASAAALRALELDVTLQVTTAFLNALKAQTDLEISRSNLQLSRDNLELAKNRVKLGVAIRSDVLRWESQLANSKAGLLRSKAVEQQTRELLNQILNRQLTVALNLRPATLDEKEILISDKRLIEYVTNDRAFWNMGQAMIDYGLSHAPELEQLDARLGAKQREVSAERRRYSRPVVSLDGQLGTVLNDNLDENFTADGDVDWNVGLNLSLPLYEGGRRGARITRAATEAEQIRYQIQDTRLQIEQNIRARLHSTKASYPTIELTRESADAANETLKIVQESYAQGTVSIIDLLDAQNNSLQAQQAAANAVYDFLIDLMNLQRSYSQFDFFLTPEQRDAFSEKIRAQVK